MASRRLKGALSRQRRSSLAGPEDNGSAVAGRLPSRRDVLRASLALGLSSLPLTLGGCSRRREARPNIVLITLDTTRVDHLGCYGYERSTSPALDALAAESVLYRRAMATSSWTLPSHASLFTGKLTTSHGARYDPGGPLRLKDAIPGPESWNRYRARGLSEGETTLAGILGEAGYATGSVVAGPWMKRAFGLDAGFDFYDDQEISTVNGRKAASVTDSAARWLEQVGDREFFLFLNYYDPHGPLTPPPELARQFLPPGTRLEPGKRLTMGQMLGLYDAEILYMDRHIGRLINGLKEQGIYDETWIFVTADHGELFGEHGRFGHGNYLYQQEIHIPMMVKHPRGEHPPGESDELVGLADVLPWICRRLELPVPGMIQGKAPGEEGRTVIAETYPLPSSAYSGSWRALFEDEYKLLWNSESSPRLFDLGRDPGEENDLAPSEPARTAAMLARLNDFLAGLPRPGDAGSARELDKETSEALEALGYVN